MQGGRMAMVIKEKCLTFITLTQQGSSSWESKWESFLAGTSAKELPTCPELKYLIREGIPYQYKVRTGCWWLVNQCLDGCMYIFTLLFIIR